MNNNNPELDRTIEEVRRELRTILIKRQELILKLGREYEKVVASKESICEEIKNCLKDEIALGIISLRTIEQSFPPEWKKKTKPKLENEKFSFSHPKPEQKQRKIVMDNHGNPVREVEGNNGEFNPEFDFRRDAKEIAQQDNELLQRQQSIIRELIGENRRLKLEKSEVQVKLGEAIESLHVHKQKEIELLRRFESTANRSEQHQNIIETEFTVGYRLLQEHMVQIFKSPTRQEMWFTVKIDVNKKKVVSAQIGRKLLPPNVAETKNNE
jgi:hypothetical protein